MILFAGLLFAAVHDARTQRIPNWLTFGLIGAALIAQGSGLGDGLTTALTGLGVAFGVHFALWQLGLEGAGDAKLMMAVGAFLGWEAMIEATLWRYILLVPYAVAAITALRRWAHFRAAVLWTFLKARGMKAGERPAPTYMPFAPLIALAVPIAMYTTWFGFFGLP